MGDRPKISEKRAMNAERLKLALCARLWTVWAPPRPRHHVSECTRDLPIRENRKSISPTPRGLHRPPHQGDDNLLQHGRRHGAHADLLRTKLLDRFAKLQVDFVGRLEFSTTGSRNSRNNPTDFPKDALKKPQI